MGGAAISMVRGEEEVALVCLGLRAGQPLGWFRGGGCSEGDIVCAR